MYFELKINNCLLLIVILSHCFFYTIFTPMIFLIAYLFDTNYGDD